MGSPKLRRFFTKPLVALSVQALVPSVGTGLLLDSKDGRNIRAAEIVVTTAVVSFCYGGCATLGTGALLGELTWWHQRDGRRRRPP